LICPWHQSKYSEKALRTQAVPLVYSQGRATVMLDAAPDAPISLMKKTILAQPCPQPHPALPRTAARREEEFARQPEPV
jgi:hypothetical protein